MATIEEAARVVKATLGVKQDKIEWKPAMLGDGHGNVDAGNNMVYVRLSENSSVIQVLNFRVSPVDGLRVRIAKTPEQPLHWQVIGQDDQRIDENGAGDGGGQYNVGPHHRTHEYLGVDQVNSDFRQITTLRCYAAGGFTVGVLAGLIPRSGADLVVPTQTLDLSGHIPVSGALYCLITIDAAGALAVTDGVNEPGGLFDLTLADIPDTPSGHYRLAAVRLYDGQSAISESTISNDMRDLRFPEEKTAGDPSALFGPQPANTVFAGPTSGADALPTFRGAITDDVVSGVFPIARGGTDADNATDALTNLLPSQSGQAGNVLTTDGSLASWGPGGGGGGGTVTITSLPVGTIVPFGGSSIPSGWLECNGASVLRASYPDLFTAIGTIYGSIDGSHFTLPDLRGRVSIGKGTGSGLSPRAIGATGGEESHTLSTAELAAHTHGLDLNDASSGSPVITKTGNNLGNVATIQSGSAGSGTAHNTMPPFLVTAWIIKYTDTATSSLIFNDAADPENVILAAATGDDVYAARRDHVHALDQGIIPTWTGQHTFTLHDIRSISDDTSGAFIHTQYSNAKTSTFAGERSRGSVASPTAVLTGDKLGRLTGRGRSTSDWSPNHNASVTLIAAEDFTDMTQGTAIDFYTTPIGTLTALANAHILSDGTLSAAQIIDNGLTASTFAYADASKQLTSLANAAGVLTNDGAGNFSYTSGGGGGTPASPDTSIQFNDGGAFGGDAGLTWDNTDKQLILSGALADYNIVGVSDGVDNFGLSFFAGDGSDVDVPGGDLEFTSGAGNGNANGGDVAINAGLGGLAGGEGGSFEIAAGDAQGGDGNGGGFSFTLGLGNGSGSNGVFSILNPVDGAYGILDFYQLNTSDKTFTFPNASGTIALTSDIGTPVTDVTASLPLLSSGGTTPDISISAASSSTDGYLTQGDWATFNGKQDALTDPVLGTGVIGRIAEWVTDTHTLQDSTLIKSGAGVLTLSAGTTHTATFPATSDDTVAMLNVANVFTATQRAISLGLGVAAGGLILNTYADNIDEAVTFSVENTPHAVVINRVDNGNVHISFNNVTTGTGLSDGTDVGIEADGTFRIRQQENKPVEFYTNNIEAWTILANHDFVSGVDGTEAHAITTAGAITGSVLKSSATSDQIVLQSAGVTGTLTWTPATSNKTITLPNATGTLLLRDANIAATRIPFGSDANTLTGSADLTWNDSTKLLSISGSIALPTTPSTSTVGVIFKGTVPFIHDYSGADANGFNTFVGLGAGNFTSHGDPGDHYQGSYNSGYGHEALKSITIGTHNNASGHYSLTNLNSGNSNNAMGDSSLYSLTSGQNCVGIGANSGYSVTTATGVTAVGYQALSQATTPDGHVAVGSFAGYGQTTGGAGVFLGYYAGYRETTGNKLYIDNAPHASEAEARTNALVYGLFDGDPLNQFVTINGKLGIGEPAIVKLQIVGDGGAPTASGSTPTGVFGLDNSLPNSLYAGLYGSGTYGGWVQVQDRTNLSVPYALHLQPIGGSVIIGSSAGGSSILRVVGLPTSAAGLSTGDVWCDTTGGLNILKVV